MTENTKIEWADHTFNPWWGCTRISAACDNCYAADWAARWGKTEIWDGKARELKKDWSKPRKWQKNAENFQSKHGRRQRVFCASMADVFDNQVPAEWRARLWDLIRETPGLDWLLLTKRPQNIEKMKPEYWDEIRGHIWLGTTVENQEAADRNIPHLLKHDSAVRFLSCEPLLGPVDLESAWFGESALSAECWGDCTWCSSGKPALHNCRHGNESNFSDETVLNWVIAGGESGPKARPSNPEWFKALRDQCNAAGVPFMFKQWGEWFPYGEIDSDGHQNSMTKGERPDQWHEWPSGFSVKLGKKLAGRLLQGKTYDQFPEG